MITLGHIKFDNKVWLIILTTILRRRSLKHDHNKKLITLNVITLNGFHWTINILISLKKIVFIGGGNSSLLSLLSRLICKISNLNFLRIIYKVLFEVKSVFCSRTSVILCRFISSPAKLGEISKEKNDEKNLVRFRYKQNFCKGN